MTTRTFVCRCITALLSARQNGGTRLLQQDVGAAAGEGDDEIHEDEHQVVVPAVGFLSSKAGVPRENFLLDGAKHDQDEAEGGKLGEDACGYAERTGNFGDSEEDRETFWQLDAFGSGLGIFEVVVAAGGEDEAHHEAEEKDSEIGETG
jgi:hypothetical protein